LKARPVQAWNGAFFVEAMGVGSAVVASAWLLAVYTASAHRSPFGDTCFFYWKEVFCLMVNSLSMKIWR